MGNIDRPGLQHIPRSIVALMKCSLHEISRNILAEEESRPFAGSKLSTRIQADNKESFHKAWKHPQVERHMTTRVHAWLGVLTSWAKKYAKVFCVKVFCC